ncbi:MAG TPA: PilZ domain-containing protein [Spirochaetia bacterium]|nr:PilZ domain-containing protein [Spirochaetia bacterium]
MDAINQVLEGIKLALHHSPLQIALAVGAAALLFLVFTTYYLLDRARQQRTELKRNRETYLVLKDRHHLNPSDEDLIYRLAHALRTPQKKYLLLSNQGVFNACAHKLVGEGEVPEAAVSALRVKLGFFADGPDASPSSSASLPTGAAVVLRYRNRAFRARVLDPLTSSLRLRVDIGQEAVVFFAGSDIQLTFQNRRGTFTFSSTVQMQNGMFLFIAHSEEVQRVQRREHFRRQTSLPVYIKSTGGDERSVPSHFIDLGGGGASLYNPGTRFRQGEEVDLTFHPESEERLSVTAHVVRTSHGKKVLHVDFGHLRESVRDRIYHLLFDKNSSRT